MLYRTFFVVALLSLRALLTTAHEAQEPIHEQPSSELHRVALHEQSTSKPHRIAIIGAGAAGSSASYHLDKFARSASLDVPLDITIIESNAHPGGRTTTVNAFDDARFPTELGGSIFVQVNHILVNASKSFGLRTSSKIYRSAPDTKYELGVWDGTEFVFTTERDDDNSSWRGWWDVAKLLWRYGLAPIRTRNAVRTAVGKFLQFYDAPLFPFKSIQSAVEETGLDAFTGVTGNATLHAANVGDRFRREIIQASTRVNYASNLAGIHGLETMVCMAIEGAMAVDGGNWQIFDEMVRRSATRAFFHTNVTGVVRDPRTHKFNLTSSSPDTDALLVDYDTVILAAPYQFANVSFHPGLASEPAKIDYNSLHVTLFASPRRPSPAYFGLTEQRDVPSSILTTLPESLDERLSALHGVEGVGPTRFWSLSTLDVVDPEPDADTDADTDGAPTGETRTRRPTQYLYKIFSPARLTGTFLAQLLGATHESGPSSPAGSVAGSGTGAGAGETDAFADPIADLPKDVLTWSHEKVWNSYPYEHPRTEFEDFSLGDGLWYTSVIEPFISTMETSALSGMNVAKLIVEELERGQVGGKGVVDNGVEDNGVDDAGIEGDWVIV